MLESKVYFSKIRNKKGQATISYSVIIHVFVLASLFVLYQVWQWFFCRIEIEPGMVGVLIAKTGKDLPPGEIIATDSRYKGIQLQVLPEGRHFYDPIFWDWEIRPMVEVPLKHVGVRICYYGRDFTEEEIKSGKIIADEGQKGIQKEVLMPGKYRINPYAEKIEIHPAVEVPAGYVGVVCWVGGTTSMFRENTDLDNKDDLQSQFLVEDGQKGVSKKVLTPGLHYLNPYLCQVYLMDCRSQRFELHGKDALKFPSSDAFEITVSLAVEWAIDPKRAPEIYVRIGEMHPEPEKNEILQKVIIPTIRGYGRIEGSKYTALDYISGNSRQVFQNTLFEKIKITCEPKGIIIKSVLINDIEPPQEIARPIREREIAKEELNKNKNQLLQAQAEQSLARSEEMVKLERERVLAYTKNKVKVIEAQNKQKVALINQEKRLKMELTLYEAAKKQAEAILSRGKAQADVITMNALAEIEGIKQTIESFKTAENFAYYEFITKIAPSFKFILANTEGMFGNIFQKIILQNLSDFNTSSNSR